MAAIADTAYTYTKTAMDTLSGVSYSASVDLDDETGDLPDTYIVGSLISDVPDQQADDVEKMAFIRVQLSIFSRDGLLNLPDTDTAMLAVGFKRAGSRELPYDPETQHYGLARDYTILLNV